MKKSCARVAARQSKATHRSRKTKRRMEWLTAFPVVRSVFDTPLTWDGEPAGPGFSIGSGPGDNIPPGTYVPRRFSAKLGGGLFLSGITNVRVKGS